MRIVVGATTLLAFACAHEPTGGPRNGVSRIVDTAVEQRVTLAPGESAAIGGTDASIWLRGVTSDSRCPRTVQCITAGRATVELELADTSLEAPTVMVPLSTAPYEDMATVHGYIMVRLLAVTPYPDSAVPIPADEYRVTLSVVVLTRLDGALLPLALVHESFGSGFDSSVALVVRDAATWREVWTRANAHYQPQPPLPPVDFSSEMIVGYAMGARPTTGYTVRLAGAAEHEGAVTVRVVETSPAATCFTGQAITTPITLARVPYRAGQVTFRVTPILEDCSG
jgi:hypothetical protein